ncbi:TadE family protein [Faecalimonas sp.]
MKTFKASLVVETAYILPVVFLSFMLGVYMLFYFHDKNILLGAGYETVVVGSQKMKWNEENIEEKMEKFFHERVRGKVIFFSKPKVIVKCKNDTLSVNASVKKRKIVLKVHQKRTIKIPEKYIRKKRKIYGK